MAGATAPVPAAAPAHMFRRPGASGLAIEDAAAVAAATVSAAAVAPVVTAAVVARSARLQLSLGPQCLSAATLFDTVKNTHTANIWLRIAYIAFTIRAVCRGDSEP